MTFRQTVILIFTLLILLPLTAQNKLTFNQIPGSPTGEISVEVVSEAYRRIGVEIEILNVFKPITLEASNAGRLDGELHRIDGMETLYPNLRKIPVPINRFETVFFSKDSTIEINSWEDLKPYSIATEVGIKIFEQHLKGNLDYSVEWVNDREQAFFLLNRNRVDGVLFTYLNGLSVIKKLDISGISNTQNPIETSLLFHYLHKSHANLIPPLTAALKQMEQEGLIDKIRDEFIFDNF